MPNFLLQQSGERFGFAASTTTRIVPPDAEPSLRALNDSYLAAGMNIAEKRNQNALADHAHSSQPPPNTTFSQHNLDPALRKDYVVERALHARPVGSDLDDSEASSSNIDIDEDEGDGGDEGDEGDEGENNDSQFHRGGAHQRRKEHPGKNFVSKIPSLTQFYIYRIFG